MSIGQNLFGYFNCPVKGTLNKYLIFANGYRRSLICNDSFLLFRT